MHAEVSQQRHGLSTDLSVETTGDGVQELWLGGVGTDQKRWQHLLNRRAAKVLWAKLTMLLYPDKASLVTSRAATAPRNGGVFGRQGLTTHVEVIETQGGYTLIGRAHHARWTAQVAEEDVRKLWARLDMVLYPVGWEGRSSAPRQPSAE